MLNNEIVLVTGGSGCIGQHIIKLLIEKKDELGVKEIRSIDLKKYENQIGHDEFAELKTFVGDVCDLSESADKIFKGVGTVFHCANLISLQYPPNLDELYHVNVDGTQKIIELCLKFNIKNLVYTSCGSVNFLPYKNSTFSIIINQTESKALTPVLDNRHKVSPVEFDKGFLIPGYASSKLRAENIVINSCGAKLSNGSDTLKTVAIRSPIIYGEGDNHFLPPLFKCLASWNNSIPRIGGAGGKHQLVYAGNVAWGHICAFKTLRDSPKSIAGLPVFITDETPINDYSRFVQRIGKESNNNKMKFTHSRWYLPHFLFYFIAFLYETMVRLLYPVLKLQLKYSWRAISSFTSSVIMFNRLRAEIHINYYPIYSADVAIHQSAKWYGVWYEHNINVGSKSKNK
ncbi:3 beta-hydroxysteroid dehydrogenase/Delta 5--_4-isomerase type 2 isoform X1 [Condylostylus longicornis]|uniref:3 beta-hydroxysteroid dehydrogenase/Delta 5-->4-isomerase type 2 isoform X1 n=1 Tax=Condylostylus longicornis TaxID=2530218 RepID=UPI00244DA1D8|nr:3 beta-hydroxysteroid dehydrogenase/Delta 5-->4-isomerase type 2 isoform X1 [Condylostylus longicornis]XP_055380708.1 3 beta-hydroxysteroid dehydrogenase/Delta 5-->4-isomerase type 2 isoform X1 [Condylostylus longicornis]XP_055380709.1 3 beta-hydroxysteroid dehydrogenase/Delta 5-->4-isomerase type 2 isoform X1 [Condylostylus longicornis]XP_055380710.1 3 beta-hydroxysteroid dehydrogenase/Delta 5-->4-isomerase type 2 isoform X1 [Condylostylus longicornis]